ncbi:MAG: chaperonin GroEL [Planctomycetes bacterium]|nr:chaperonin GroEL [Planctomycetota bacterium]
MAAKQLVFDEIARAKVLTGLQTLAQAVKVTLGPKGRNVIIEKSFGSPTVTKDGVTVAKEIELEDPFENMGAQLVKEAASKSSDKAGDGTTTATVLTEAIYKEGLKYVTAGANPTELKKGIDSAVNAVIGSIADQSTPCQSKEDISNVAAISANNDGEVGKTISEAMDKVGKDGVVTVEEGKSLDTTLDLVEGMCFDKGYQSPYFITDNEAQTAIMEDAYVLTFEKKIGNLRELVPLLEKVSQSGKPLVIISEEVEGDALAALVVNKLRGTLKIACCKAPGFGDRRKSMLEDIAIFCNGTFVSEDLGIKLDSIELDQLGQAKKIILEKDQTVIIEGGGSRESIEGRISLIRSQIDATTSDYDREKLQERLAKLTGGVAVINVGAATEAEMKETKARIEDALHAARAAAEEGIVPGGGIALLKSLAAVEKVKAKGDAKLGVKIIAKALVAPIMAIAENCGQNGALIADQALSQEGSVGYNALTDTWEDLIKSGVIDPAKVTRMAIQNAASIAGIALTVETMVAELPKGDVEKAVIGSVT